MLYPPRSRLIDFKDQLSVFQYEVKYRKRDNCSGGYLKLLKDGFQDSERSFEDKIL